MACHRSRSQGLRTLFPKRRGYFSWILDQGLGITLFTLSLVIVNKQAPMIWKSRVSSSILSGKFPRIPPTFGRPS